MTSALDALIAFRPADIDSARASSSRLERVAHVVLSEGQGAGSALREGIGRLTAPVTLVLAPGAAPSAEDIETLTRPLHDDDADVVYGYSQGHGAGVLPLLSRWASDSSVRHPFQGVAAFRTDILKALVLKSEDEDIFAEILVKVSAQLYRILEVPLQSTTWPSMPFRTQMKLAKTLFHYATSANDTDNLHEGYNTLSRMEGGAPNYNAWLGQRFREYCGKRVLEIGAGIGTITSQLEEGRELLIALEVDPFYVERLKNRFRGKAHVRPYLSDVALADWQRLREERIDSIVLSNVLEHIPDDADAVRRFRDILPQGGHLIILVPALPALFGSMDEAVGHHRRYTREGLSKLLEDNGFSIERLEWMNLVGIPGWFVNGRIFKRRAVPPLQLRMYDSLAPLFAKAESQVSLPVGMSLFAVAKVK